jgi:hypothetical protein
MVFLVGMLALWVVHAFSWPLILVVLAATFLVRAAERGRIEQAMRTVLIAGAGVFVISHPRMWPLLLIVFGVMKLIGSGRRVW